MITITLEQGINAVRRAFPYLTELDLPLDLSFRLGAVIERLDKEAARYDKARNKRVRELGERQDDDTYKLLGANLEQFNEEIERLEAQELHLDWEPIKPRDLGVKNGRGLAAVFSYARWLFLEKPAEKPAEKADAVTP